MKTIKRIGFCRSFNLSLIVAAFLFGLPAAGQAAPVLTDSNYNISLFVTGAGAVDGMAFSNSGDLYFTDYQGWRILKVASPYTSGTNSYSVYATGVAYPTDLAFASDGRLLVTSSTSSSSNILQIAQGGTSSVFATGFSYPTSIASFGNNLFVANSGNGTISKVDLAGNVSGFLSGFSTPNGPFGNSFDSVGNLYFTDHGTGQVYRSDQSGNVQLLGAVSPFGATFTGFGLGGNLFVSDVQQGKVYKINSSGNLSLFASGFVGKSSPPVIGPTDIVFDSAGSMYIGDGASIWKVSAVPLPAAVWLFGSGLVGLIGFGRSRRRRH